MIVFVGRLRKRVVSGKPRSDYFCLVGELDYVLILVVMAIFLLGGQQIGGHSFPSPKGLSPQPRLHKQHLDADTLLLHKLDSPKKRATILDQRTCSTAVPGSSCPA